MKHKRKLSLVLALALGVTPVLSSVYQSKSYAEEIKETKISEINAKKLGIKVSDIEFSNIDNSTINRIFSGIKPNYVGINSETIETKTFTRSELIALKKIQQAIYDWHVDNISTSDCKYIVNAAISVLSSYGASKITAVLGWQVGAVYLGIDTLLGYINNSAKNTMTMWLRDGKNLIQQAINTGKSKVTLKYVKLSWKTSGVSVITGGIILK